MRRVPLVLTALATALVVAGGVSWAAVIETGDSGNNVIFGTGGSDKLSGGVGNDRVSGGKGDDFMDGGAQAPSPTKPAPFEGVPNNADVLIGGKGDDDIDGNFGPDRIEGGSGDDALSDGENHGGTRDILTGGFGDDVLLPGNVPPVQDMAYCGPGSDTAFADRLDVVVGCERVLFRPPTPADLR
jgi:Ca2+-binding RTX toxin-like protein